MTEHSTLEERLSRSLDRQAAGLTDAPFGIADVRGRARSIRNRRRGVAAGVVAAVVAVALPTALLAGPGDDRTDGVDPATPASTRATVLHDGVVTLPDGREVAAPYDEVTELATLSDGRIVLMLPRRAVVLDESGAEQASYPVLVNDLTTGDEGRTVAWIGADRRIQVLESGQEAPTAMGRVPRDVYAVEVVRGDDCAEGLCTAWVGDGTRITRYVDLDGSSPVAADTLPFERVWDVSSTGELWAVELPPARDEQYGCAALWHAVEARIVAETCETSELRFSPDDRLLLGLRGDNGMYGEASVLDAELRPVLTYEPDGGQVISRAAWADATHLDVSVVDPDTSTWSLVRVGVDGSTEVLDGPAPGGNPESVAEYVFAE